MSKRAILVARVSTDAQAKYGYSLPTQLDAMRRYASANDFEVAKEITDDCSGSIPIYERPGGKQLLAAIRARSADAIIFYTIDRASRDEDVIDFIMLKRDLREAGIELHFSDTGKSEHDSVTGIVEYIRVSEAGRERRKISGRVRRGKVAKAASGKWVGTSNPPYGYRQVGTKRDAKLEVDPDEAAVVRRVFALYLGAGRQPIGIMGIAAVLTEEGVPPPSTKREMPPPVYDSQENGEKKKETDPGKRGKRNTINGWYGDAIKSMLKRRAYIGEFVSYGHTATWPELAIVDPVTFNAVQERFEQSRAVSGIYERKYEYLLSGRLRCSCGQGMLGHGVQGGRYRYYVCYYASKERHLRNCDEPYFRAELPDAVSWGWVVGLLSDSEILNEGLEKYGEKREEELQPLRERLAGLEEQIADAERRIRVLAEEFSKEKDEFIAATLREQQRLAGHHRAAARAARDQVINKLTRSALSDQDKALILERATEVTSELGELTFEKKRSLLAMLDFQAQIEYRGGEKGLFVTCGIKLDGEWVSLEKDGPFTPKDSFDQLRIVFFSAWLSLDNPAGGLK